MGHNADDFHDEVAVQPLKPFVKAEAMRFDDNKLRLDLIPWEAELELARVYTMGAIKYDDNNWRKGMAYSKCMGALRRHLLLWQSGQAVDPETGCHHLAQVAWNALTLMVYELRGVGKDDRVKGDVNSDFTWKDNKLNIGLAAKAMAALREKFKDRK